MTGRQRVLNAVENIGDIKAVIFDWGGVLVDDPGPGLIAYCSEALAVSKKRFVEVCRPHLIDFQTGQVSEEVLWREACAELGVATPDTPSLWGDAFRSVYSPKPEMFALVGRLRGAGFLTALLSNTEVPAVAYYRELGYEQFDVAVFSCDVHLRKPETDIYELTCERLGVQLDQALLVDDRSDNIESAARIGMKTILFSSPAVTVAWMEQHSILSP